MQRMSNQVKNMRALLLMLFAALSLSVSAQTVSITGNVTVSYTHLTLPTN